VQSQMVTEGASMQKGPNQERSQAIGEVAQEGLSPAEFSEPAQADSQHTERLGDAVGHERPEAPGASESTSSGGPSSRGPMVKRR